VSPVRREMTDEEMRRYLTEVGEHLAARGITGEIVLAGGAVMVMALHARGGSNDIDAVFTHHAEAIRPAAREVADRHGLPAMRSRGRWRSGTSTMRATSSGATRGAS